MVRMLLALVMVLCLTSDASAFGRRGRFFGGGNSGGWSGGRSSGFMAVPAGCSNSTAQGVAECMAKVGVCGHFGGNPSFEGCGMAATKDRAYAICCYANSGMTTVDVGYAQGANGYWFCCRRYR